MQVEALGTFNRMTSTPYSPLIGKGRKGKKEEKGIEEEKGREEYKEEEFDDSLSRRVWEGKEERRHGDVPSSFSCAVRS